MPSSSTSPVTTPYCGSSPVVNLAMRTARAYRRGRVRARAYPGALWRRVPDRAAMLDEPPGGTRARTRRGSTRWIAAAPRAPAPRRVRTRSRTSSSPTTPTARPRCAAGTPGRRRRWPAARRLRRRWTRVRGSTAAGAVGVDVEAPRWPHAGDSVRLRARRCWPRPRRARRSSAASGCTSGRWSTGSRPSEVRHADWPLRLGADGHRRGRGAHRIRCSHFDAFRFFTAAGPAAATPCSPTRDDRPDVRAAGLPARRHGPLQVGLQAQPRWCLASWSPTASSWPATSASSTCARRRTTCASSGYEPVRIETAEGKAEYVAAQRAFAERAQALRARLVDGLRRGCWARVLPSRPYRPRSRLSPWLSSRGGGRGPSGRPPRRAGCPSRG